MHATSRFRIALGLSFIAICFLTNIHAHARPNIVVILCDDLGYGDLECYGHAHIKTPHLNRLAAGGIRFTDCYSAAPVCSPSRVGLLTGRSPNRAGVYDWIPPAGTRPKPDAREQVHMGAQEITVSALLQASGYATCMAGKWHCNSQFNSSLQPQPNDFGFDHWFGTQNNAAPSHANPINFIRNGKKVNRLQGYSCQLVIDEAISWLGSRDAAKPFFLFLPFHEPHEPVASPAELVQSYANVAGTKQEAEYFANVANVDAAVGRLIEFLDQQRLRENTLVLFTSDNGPETLRRYRGAGRSYGTPGPLRGMKLHTHEAGFRVVGIANWKGTIDPRKTISQPVSSLDFLPTFCKLARATVPHDLELDGMDIGPLFKGQRIERQRPLFWCYFNAINEARFAMRKDNWKFLARLNRGQFPRLQNVTPKSQQKIAKTKLTDFELYDLSTDLNESKNLIDQKPEVTAALVEESNKMFRELVASSRTWTPQVPVKSE